MRNTALVRPPFVASKENDSGWAVASQLGLPATTIAQAYKSASNRRDRHLIHWLFALTDIDTCNPLLAIMAFSSSVLKFFLVALLAVSALYTARATVSATGNSPERLFTLAVSTHVL